MEPYVEAPSWNFRKHRKIKAGTYYLHCVFIAYILNYKIILQVRLIFK